MPTTPTIPLQALALVRASTPAASAAATEAISRKAECATGHAVDKKGVRSSYEEIAAKYEGDAKAPGLLAQRVRKGSAGVPAQMPVAATPPDQLSDADRQAVVARILAR